MSDIIRVTPEVLTVHFEARSLARFCTYICQRTIAFYDNEHTVGCIKQSIALEAIAVIERRLFLLSQLANLEIRNLQQITLRCFTIVTEEPNPVTGGTTHRLVDLPLTQLWVGMHPFLVFKLLLELLTESTKSLKMRIPADIQKQMYADNSIPIFQRLFIDIKSNFRHIPLMRYSESEDIISVIIRAKFRNLEDGDLTN